MDKKTFIRLALAGGFLLIAVFVVYVINFGFWPSEKQEHWGQFGDYVGGILNPTFSLLAFLGLMWSIKMQSDASALSNKKIIDDNEQAKKELDQIRRDRLVQDMLVAIRDIDARIEKILEHPLGNQNDLMQPTMYLMNAEAERIHNEKGQTSPAYESFISLAKTKGTVVEAKTRELDYLIRTMHEFFKNRALSTDNHYTLALRYYAQKGVRLFHMMRDIGILSSDTEDSFKNIAKMD
jgi:hypothetical protein